MMRCQLCAASIVRETQDHYVVAVPAGASAAFPWRIVCNTCSTAMRDMLIQAGITSEAALVLVPSERHTCACCDAVIDDSEPHYHVPIGGGHDDVCVSCCELIDTEELFGEPLPVNGAPTFEELEDKAAREFAELDSWHRLNRAAEEKP